MSKKILITGSRDFNDYKLFEDVLIKTYCKTFGDLKNIEIIHGGATGADTLAHEFCENWTDNETIIRPVNLSISSYYLHRNAEMVAVCDEVLAFWDGKSRGTKFTIDYAKARGKPVKIIEV